MVSRSDEKIKADVHAAYSKIIQNGCSGCSCNQKKEETTASIHGDYAQKLGYTEEDLKEAPLGANLGLGCGNPTAIAGLKKGEVVIDLGSGGGFDCFLASKKVGPSGKVFGVDMTPEMIDLARQNAQKKGGGYENVEFRLGEIERLPIPDAIADVVMALLTK